MGAWAGRSSGRTCRYKRPGGGSLACVDVVVVAARVRTGRPSVTLARTARVGELPYTPRVAGMRGADVGISSDGRVKSTARDVNATGFCATGARAARLERIGSEAGIGESHVRMVSREMDIDMEFSFAVVRGVIVAVDGGSARKGLLCARPMDVIGRSGTWSARRASEVVGRRTPFSSDIVRHIVGEFLAVTVLGASAR